MISLSIAVTKSRKTLVGYAHDNDSDHDTLKNLPSVESSWLNCLSSYHPDIINYIYGKYYPYKNRFSNYKRRTVGIGRPRKMSRYKEYYSYEKLSKFKQ